MPHPHDSTYFPLERPWSAPRVAGPVGGRDPVLTIRRFNTLLREQQRAASESSRRQSPLSGEVQPPSLVLNLRPLCQRSLDQKQLGDDPGLSNDDNRCGPRPEE